jgi:hypothetical protein
MYDLSYVKTINPIYLFLMFLFYESYFKRKYRMHRSLKHEGTRRGILNLAGTGGQKEGFSPFTECTLSVLQVYHMKFGLLCR